MRTLQKRKVFTKTWKAMREPILILETEQICEATDAAAADDDKQF